MNKTRFLSFILIIGTLVLSACGAAAPSATPAPVSADQTGELMPVSFVGIVDSIAGDQWVISGTTVTVHESIVRNGPFKVGDTIKVEGFVKADGSFTVARVETPTAQDALTATPFAVDNSNDVNANANANANANINDDNSNSLNSNDDNSNSLNSNDDNSNTVNSNDDNGSGNSNDNKGGNNSNDDNGGGGGGGGNSNGGNGNGG